MALDPGSVLVRTRIHKNSCGVAHGDGVGDFHKDGGGGNLIDFGQIVGVQSLFEQGTGRCFRFDAAEDLCDIKRVVSLGHNALPAALDGMCGLGPAGSQERRGYGANMGCLFPPCRIAAVIFGDATGANHNRHVLPDPDQDLIEFRLQFL